MNKKTIAAIVTVYRRHSHADVIVGKILEGYDHQGGPGPNLRLASLYVDQHPDGDMSRDLARKHGFPLFDTIESALTLGGKQLAVNGVLCIGEHGKYETNARGQILYPRRRFFEEVAKTFVTYKKSVPVFNDKHLAARWSDAQWMYDKARELFVPFMAGPCGAPTGRGAPPPPPPRAAPAGGGADRGGWGGGGWRRPPGGA